MFNWFSPNGFILIRESGIMHNVLRGDMIPKDTLVIVSDGRYFVRSPEKPQAGYGGFWVYREGYKTTPYESQGA